MLLVLDSLQDDWIGEQTRALSLEEFTYKTYTGKTYALKLVVVCFLVVLVHTRFS